MAAICSTPASERSRAASERLRSPRWHRSRVVVMPGLCGPGRAAVHPVAGDTAAIDAAATARGADPHGLPPRMPLTRNRAREFFRRVDRALAKPRGFASRGAVRGVVAPRFAGSTRAIGALLSPMADRGGARFRLPPKFCRVTIGGEPGSSPAIPPGVKRRAKHDIRRGCQRRLSSRTRRHHQDLPLGDCQRGRSTASRGRTRAR